MKPKDEHKASEVVAKLNADTEDNWTYKVFECVATGLFYVSTHDEDGIFVGNLQHTGGVTMKRTKGTRVDSTKWERRSRKGRKGHYSSETPGERVQRVSAKD